MKPDDTIELIEPTPKPKNRRCKAIVLVIALLLSYGAFLFAGVIWYLYGIIYGIAGLLIGYLVMGILRAKLRNSVIPRRQQEYHYTDRAIAAWYVNREFLDC